MKARFYGYSILVLGMAALLASCKSPTSSPSKAWVVSTLAGSGTAGSANGVGTSAKFNRPYGVAVNSDGNVYVADIFNNRIRKITIKTVNSQEVADVSSPFGSGTAGSADGTGTAARFNNPSGVAVDSDGNIYVADTSSDYSADTDNHRIRKITVAGVVSTIAGSTSGDDDGTTARFNDPSGVAVHESSGNIIIYVADFDNLRIRKMEYRVP